MAKYLCRICWNSLNWERPSGDGRLLEAKDGKSYVAKWGFGHEEWLFDYRGLSDGWKFGFLQSLSKLNMQDQNAMRNEPSTIFLFARMKDGVSRCFAKIHKAWIPTDEDAKAAAHRDGELLYGLRVADLKQVLDEKTLQKTLPRFESERSDSTWVNVKFRPEDVTFFDHPFDLSITSKSRYQTRVWDPDCFLAETEALLGAGGAGTEEITDLRDGPAQGRTTLVRKGVSDTLVDLMHKRIQRVMREWLTRAFPDCEVSPSEIDRVDVTLWRGARYKVLFEIKTATEPRACIREALGQLLEYNHYGSENLCKANDLVIVGTERLGSKDKAYLETLISKYGLPIAYTSVDLKTGALADWQPGT